MADVAQLGLAVDSRQVKDATTALDRFTVSGKAAAEVSDKIAAAQSRGKGPQADFAAGVKGVDDAQTKQKKSADAVIASLVDQNVKLNSTARQWAIIQAVQKAGVPLNSATADSIGKMAGANYDLEQSQNKAEQAGSKLANTLTRRVVFGLIASQIKQAAAAVFQLNAELAKTGDIASRNGLGSALTQGIASAGANKGLDGAKLADDMLAFNSQVTLAKQGLGSLGTLLTSNGLKVTDTKNAFFDVATLVQRSTGDFEKQASILQQAGLPATREMVRFMEQGRDAIQAQADATKKFSQAQLDEAQRIDDRWNKVWENFKREGKSAILDVFDPNSYKIEIIAGSFADKIRKGIQDARGWADRNANGLSSGLTGSNQSDWLGVGSPKGSVTRGADLAAPSTVKVFDPAKYQQQVALEQQRLGILGQTASIEETVRGTENAIAVARLNHVKITNDEANNLTRIARENALGISTMKASADAQRVEADTIGMSTGNAAAYAAAQNAINQAKRDGRPLTADNIAAIQQEASALGAATSRTENLRFAYEGLVRGPLQAFRTELQNGASFFDALKKAGLSALDSISSKLMDMAAQNLFKAALGGSSGGGLLSLLGFGGGSAGIAGGAAVPTFGAAGGLAVPTFHTGFGPGDAIKNTRYVHPAHFNDAPRFHSGIGPGEKAAIIRNDESVLTPGQMKAAGGKGSSVTIVQNNTFNNADPGSEARMRAALSQTKDQAVREAVQQVSKITGTTPGYAPGVR